MQLKVFKKNHQYNLIPQLEARSACELHLSSYQINSVDINSAFLQGKPIARDIFIVPPPEGHTTKLWKLQKCEHGLNDTARKWYFAVYEELEKLGCLRS